MRPAGIGHKNVHPPELCQCLLHSLIYRRRVSHISSISHRPATAAADLLGNLVNLGLSASHAHHSRPRLGILLNNSTPDPPPRPRHESDLAV